MTCQYYIHVRGLHCDFFLPTIPQPLLALRSLAYLIEVYEFDPLPQLQSFYQNALAHYSELVLFLRDGDEGLVYLTKRLMGVTEALCDVTSIKGKAAQELQASQLYCQLSLAELRLNTGQVGSFFISLL